jgi:hypothetical protein
LRWWWVVGGGRAAVMGEVRWCWDSDTKWCTTKNDLGERAMETGNAAREWIPRPR